MQRTQTRAARSSSLYIEYQLGQLGRSCKMRRIQTGEARLPSLCTEYQREQLGHPGYEQNTNRGTQAMHRILTGTARPPSLCKEIPTGATRLQSLCKPSPEHETDGCLHKQSCGSGGDRSNSATVLPTTIHNRIRARTNTR